MDALSHHGVSHQDILHAALLIEETQTVGGSSGIGESRGGRGSQTEWLDRALSITRHIRDHERERLTRWVRDTGDRWPRIVRQFWRRVPAEAIRDMCPIAAEIV